MILSNKYIMMFYFYDYRYYLIECIHNIINLVYNIKQNVIINSLKMRLQVSIFPQEKLKIWIFKILMNLLYFC